MNSRHIELAVARYFNARQNLIVPNVSWGLWEIGHECDMLIVRQSGFAVEVEIKISRSDLKKDQQKSHAHQSSLLRQLWFAIPEKLQNCTDLIPDKAGILVAYPDSYLIKVLRPARVNPTAKKLTEQQLLKVAKLGCMRIWTLKQKLENKTEWSQRMNQDKAAAAEQVQKVVGR